MDWIKQEIWIGLASGQDDHLPAQIFFNIFKYPPGIKSAYIVGNIGNQEPLHCQVVLTEEGSVGPIIGWISETIGRHLSFSILLNHNRDDPAGNYRKTI